MLNSVRFDWFSFTIKGKSLEKVMSDLGLKTNEFELNSHGFYGYSSMIKHDTFDISLLFGGTDDMGIHVTISGTAIKYFMECFMQANGEKTPFGTYATSQYRDQFMHFADYVLKNGKFSRVDVNIDTDMSFMNPYHLLELIRFGDMISYYRSWNMYENSDGSGTLYLGKRNSSSFIRIYDKAKEQGDFKSTLYRFECQFNKSSNNFMLNFMENGLSGAFGAFVEKQLRFCPGGDYFVGSYEEWTAFVDLIKKGEDYDFTHYDTKKRKNVINSLFHMFTQYKDKLDTFFCDFGNIDDFIEFMFAVADGSENDFADFPNYLELKGWVMA